MRIPKASGPPRPRARAVTICAEGVKTPVALDRLSVLAHRVLRSLHVPRAMLSITLVDARTMATLNRRHLGHRGPTDVITFAFGEDPSGVLVADIYVCPSVAREQALAHGVGVREEIARLVVHGTLHACGWEHPDTARTESPMWRRQEQLLTRHWTSPRPGQ